MKEFNLCKHLDESKDTVRKIIKRGEKNIDLLLPIIKKKQSDQKDL